MNKDLDGVSCLVSEGFQIFCLVARKLEEVRDHIVVLVSTQAGIFH